VPSFPGVDSEAVSAVARLFGTEAIVEPYSPDGGPVYRLNLTGAADGVSLVLWPSLNRVDVSSTGNHAWVMKNVAAVDVVPGVEVIFRPADGPGYLFVSVNGWVNMVVG